MFDTPPSSRRPWIASLAFSFALHAAYLGVLLWQHRPIFISPSYMAAGEWGKSTRIVYLAQRGDGVEERAKPAERPRISPPKKVKPRAASEPSVPSEATKDANLTRGAAPRAGSPYGSLALGPTDGHDVRPALPTLFSDPVIRRSELPAGVEGNIMIEITIDEAGNIIGMQVRQALGYGIEEKCLAALQRWRFRPATRDGVAIASKQYVYFHIPTNS
jgi:TonB family protein